MDSGQRILLYAILFGVIVIIIWVAQSINRRKAEKHRVVMKTGPRIERFVDPGKAVKPDAVYTKAESSAKAMKWWEQSCLPEGICGVCNCCVKHPNGYLIPLPMVVQSPSYLLIAAKPIMEFGVMEAEAVQQVKDQILADKAPWLVCEDCSKHFFVK